MNNVEKMEKEINKREKEIQEIRKDIDKCNAACNRITSEIDAYIRTNSDAEERRLLDGQRAKLFKTGIGLLVAFAVIDLLAYLGLWLGKAQLTGLLGFGYNIVLVVSLLVPTVLIYFAVRKFIDAAKLAKSIKDISTKLTEFDKELKPMEKELKAEKNKVRDKEKELEKAQKELKAYQEELEFEKKYAQFDKNYAMVLVGEKGPLAGGYQQVNNVIEIDGVDQGSSAFPVKPIFVEPGTHTIKVTVQDTKGDQSHLTASNVIEFDASASSVYFEFEYIGPQGFRVNQYKTAAEFFKGTKQKKQ